MCQAGTDLSRYCHHAAVHVALGREQEALGLLEKADSEGLLWPCDIELSWLYDPIRADPRFTKMLRGQGPEP